VSDVPIVLGTAGHVDHGKTALVLALTGRDTDRLPEEKARGISIALGFAPLELPSGRRVSLVDVPGHERFVRHMVAGASGVDGYLLCVAADDGVMPQTAEHIAVLRLLGVADGVVAVTKSDLADPVRAIAEVRDLVGASPEVVTVSSVTGEGLTDLRDALERLADRTRRRTGRGRPRLFVDRAFSVAGAGTVVTGTLWGDPIEAGERVAIIPGGRTGRVRGLQVHDETVARADGGRVALNLGGIDRDHAPRGSCVVRTADGWRPTTMLDVAVDWLADAGTSLRTRRRLQAFLGTTEVAVTCVLLEGDEIPPGARAYAQFRLEAEVAAATGDRLVLRSAERRTVGGATVIDPEPVRHGRGSGAAARLALLERADPAALLRLRLAEAGVAGTRVGETERAAVEKVGGVLLRDDLAVDGAIVDEARSRLLAALRSGGLPLSAAYHAAGLGADAAAALVDGLTREGKIVRDGARVAIAGDRARSPLADEVRRLLDDAGLRPPGPTELGERLGVDQAHLATALRELRDEGSVVDAGGLWFAAAAAATAREHAAEALARGPIAIGELRDLWGVGRRHALALAAHLDATGLTRRVGDERVLRRGAITSADD
jgi:selenocysteine-specific elongation factor